jgi:starch phosphorylase
MEEQDATATAMAVIPEPQDDRAPASDGLDALFVRHLMSDAVVEPTRAYERQRFEAAARSVRDILSQRWIDTQHFYDQENPKRVYYLSMEFLIGRSLSNNITNLMLHPFVERAEREHGLDVMAMVEQEPDAGLGNGGLGRLAACFLDSMATMHLPAMGYGLRYEYGMFSQSIVDGWQRERPDNWLRRQDPWEISRRSEAVEVKLGGTFEMHQGSLQIVPNRPSTLIGVPYDRPVIGFGGKTINSLRLWGAAAHDSFDFQEFSTGDFVGALVGSIAAHTVTRVLYPDDSTEMGQGLRFVQEYFLVACSLADLVRRFRRDNADWSALPDKAAIQLNDTHPTLAVPELMRILLDDAQLGWDEAWDLTRRTLAYTNHTLLPEALEKWPLHYFQQLLPRQLEIIYEINHRFLAEVRRRYPGDEARVERVSLIEEGAEDKVRMANLAIVGSHSTNGVAAIHSQLLRSSTVKDLAEIFPERFSNKTNGVTPRRWLPAGQSRLGARHHEGDRRGLDDGFRPGREAETRRRRRRFPPGVLGDEARRQGAVRQLAERVFRSDDRSGQHFRLPGQAHPRVQAADAERAARGGPLQPAPDGFGRRHGAANLLFRGQGGARLSACQADHQVHQQSRRHDRRRSCRTRTAQGGVSPGIRCFARRTVDSGR